MQNLPFDHLFCNFIPGQSLSGKLGTLVIEHAELSREERTLTLWLFSETYLTQKDEAALKDGLQAQYGLRRVEQELANTSNGLQDNIRDITANINSRL